MKNKNLLDQFFLRDKVVLEKIISLAKLSKNDRVLEIGPGKGILTQEIAKRAGEVIAVEIDKNFRADLKTLPPNVKVIFDDVLKILEGLKFNKVVSNLPSSLVEALMHKFTKIDFDLAVFLVPLKFVHKISTHPIFSAYFEISFLEKVARVAFAPPPKTNWAIIKIRRKSFSKLNTGNFLVRYVYEHRQAKLKNSLREALIKYYHLLGKKLTKNQARKLVKTKAPPSFI